MSLPLSHAGGSVDGISAALDLRFASSLSLTSTSGLTPSFSRASTGTYFNSSGVLTSAAINGPRFDHVYNGSSWVSKGLLIEEQRTNLCTYSEQLGHASWNFLTNITVSTNVSVAPDNTVTADLIYPTASGAHCEIGKSVGTVSLSPVIYTNSYYLKSSGKIWARVLSIRGDFGAWFNLSNGTIGTILSGSVATIQNVGNGWYRCTVARTTDFSTGYTFVKISDSDNGNSVTASGTDGILVWGAQVESGAFPTSYIPTTTATVTRSADVCQITGSNFSSFWNASEGSLVTSCDRLAVGNLDNYLFKIINSGGSNSIYHEYYNGADGFQVYYGAGTPPSLIFSPATTDKTNFACGFNATGNSFVKNGSAAISATTTSMGTGYINFSIGNSGSSNFWNGHISRLRYFNKRLTNSQLQGLT